MPAQSRERLRAARGVFVLTGAGVRDVCLVVGTSDAACPASELLLRLDD